MKKTICVISSKVIAGQVGINAITPALRALSLDSFACPTILLSSHPAAFPQFGAPPRLDMSAETMSQMLTWLVEASGPPPALITGYMPSVDHVTAVARFIDQLREKTADLVYLCDPICGDRGRLYIAEEVANAIRTSLLPRADITTPNLFELGWLTGQSTSTTTNILNAARSLPCREVIVTSTPAPSGRIATIRTTKTEAQRVETDCEPRHIHGMGDMFAALYLGLFLQDDGQVLGRATATMAALARAATANGDLPSQPIEIAASAPIETLL